MPDAVSSTTNRTTPAISGAAPACVAITGASRGLGRALAIAYAEAGRRLALTARDATLLEQVAEECRRRGAEVETCIADVTTPGALAAWLRALDARQPIDLLIANAGRFDGRRGGADGEAMDDAIGVLRVNLEGVVRTIDAVLPLMIARRRGHIAVISSLAAVYPLADAPAYSASKAGLAAYGESLRELVASHGVAVAVVYPGHIATRQTEVQDGAVHMLMTPEVAAQRIRKGLARRRSRIWLPLTMALLARLGGALPPKLRQWTGRGFRFRVRESSSDS